MSSPHVVVSAVHQLDEDSEAFWNDENVREQVTNLDDDFRKDRWYMCRAQFRSYSAGETFEVKTPYHSSRGGHVAEIELSGRCDIQDIHMTGLEEIINEINYRFNRGFTLEVYYWYDGVDKLGGV